MKNLITVIIFLTLSLNGHTQTITGETDWESLQLRSTVSLELAPAGIKLPAGRTQGESIIKESYTHLIQNALMELQVDSGTTIADLIKKGEITLPELDALSIQSYSIPAALSPDMLKLSASYSLPITHIIKALQKHPRPSPAPRVLNPSSAAVYTGIVIIASEDLPAHGMKSSFLPVPCLFPKIWDTDMNLIYDRNMVTPGIPVTRYSSPMNVLSNTPSGLSRSLQQIAGDRPLRIFARGVFGIKPTDLIIDREDALQIISVEENRNLLTQGKVVIILNDSVLRSDFNF